ncbi:hypothetical protein ACWPKS_15840 [Coraliomargarita sp. W4R72]
MSNPVRVLFRYASERLDQRPVLEQIEILEAIAGCTNDVNEEEQIQQHADTLRAELARTTQLSLTFKKSV